VGVGFVDNPLEAHSLVVVGIRVEPGYSVINFAD
jgi:hypothetical protein